MPACVPYHQSGGGKGVPWLASVLLALRELAEYTEAELVRAKVASLYCGYVATADGSNPLASATGVAAHIGHRLRIRWKRA